MADASMMQCMHSLFPTEQKGEEMPLPEELQRTSETYQSNTPSYQVGKSASEATAVARIRARWASQLIIVIVPDPSELELELIVE